jgi:hypothetical protein
MLRAPNFLIQKGILVRLYVVRLSGGITNKNWQRFFENVGRLNGKSPDFAGISSTVLLKHPLDETTVRILCTDGFKGKNHGLSVEEITRSTLNDQTHYHHVYTDMVNHYFLPNDNYPSIQ